MLLATPRACCPDTDADTGTPSADTADTADTAAGRWTFYVFMNGDNDLEELVFHD